MQNLPLETIAWVSLGFFAFALIHSLLARSALKEKVLSVYPKAAAFYRFIYVCIAVFTLWLWWYFVPDMGTVVYSIRFPFNLLFYGVQTIAVLGFIQSLRSSGTQSFLGIKQMRLYLKKKKLPGYLDEPSDENLYRSGLYKYVRHPLYTFSILLMLARPDMTLRWAILTVLFTLYFWIGSYFEERELIKRFGEKYITYQNEVPRFIPTLKQFFR